MRCTQLRAAPPDVPHGVLHGGRVMCVCGQLSQVPAALHAGSDCFGRTRAGSGSGADPDAVPAAHFSIATHRAPLGRPGSSRPDRDCKQHTGAAYARSFWLSTRTAR